MWFIDSADSSGSDADEFPDREHGLERHGAGFFVEHR
jgi:hypothetical protein